MAIFSPNVTVYYYAATGFTMYGESTFGARTPVRVNIIDFKDISTPTPVRSEASSTHARAEEQVAVAKLLFPAGHSVATDDRVDVNGTVLQVSGIRPRSDLFGRPQHIEVELKRLKVPVSQEQGAQ
jgi:hypothetical protein